MCGVVVVFFNCSGEGAIWKSTTCNHTWFFLFFPTHSLYVRVAFFLCTINSWMWTTNLSLSLTHTQKNLTNANQFKWMLVVYSNKHSRSCLQELFITKNSNTFLSFFLCFRHDCVVYTRLCILGDACCHWQISVHFRWIALSTIHVSQSCTNINCHLMDDW